MKMAPRTSRSRRTRVGQGLVELCVGLVAAIPFVLAAIDLGFIALGAAINDSVCEQAARAAAAGAPARAETTSNYQVTSGEAPFQRAVTVIKKEMPTTFPMKVSENPVIFETIKDIPPADMGGAVDGEISVTTNATITPPFILASVLRPDGLQVTSKHVVTYTYVVLQQKPKD